MAEETILFFITADGTQALDTIQQLIDLLAELSAAIDDLAAQASALDGLAASFQVVTDAVTNAAEAAKAEVDANAAISESATAVVEAIDAEVASIDALSSAVDGVLGSESSLPILQDEIASSSAIVVEAAQALVDAFNTEGIVLNDLIGPIDALASVDADFAASLDVLWNAAVQAAGGMMMTDEAALQLFQSISDLATASLDAASAISTSATSFQDLTAAAAEVNAALADIAAAATDDVTAFQDLTTAAADASAAVAAQVASVIDGTTALRDFTVAEIEAAQAAADLAAAMNAGFVQSAIDATNATNALAAGYGTMTTAADAAGMSATALNDNLTPLGQSFFNMGADVADAGVSLDSVNQTAQGSASALDSLVPTLNDAGQGFFTLGDNANTSMSDLGGYPPMIESIRGVFSDLGNELGMAAQNFRDLIPPAEEAGAAMAGARDQASQMADMMLIMVGMALVQAAQGFITLGMDAQVAMSRISGLADQALAGSANIRQLGQVTDQVAALAMKWGVSMTEAATGLYFVMSAGYNVSDSMKILSLSLEASAATGATMQSVASGLTSAMHAYNAPVSQAAQYTNDFIQAIVSGKQTSQEFANVVGELASVAAASGISFKQAAAAEAAMSQGNDRVLRNTQDLMHLMETLHYKLSTIEANAKALKIHFDAAAFSTMTFQQKLEYLAKIAGGDTSTAFRKLLTDQTSARAAMQVLADKGAAYSATLKAQAADAHALSTAYAQYSTTIKAASDKVSAAVSVMAMRLVNAVSPIIIPYLENVASRMDYLATHTQVLMPILAGLAGLIGGILIAAIVILGGMLISILAPFALLIVACAALGVAIALVIQHFSAITSWFHQVTAAGTPLGTIIAFVGKTFSDIGTVLRATVVPIFSQLGQIVTSNLIPAWNGLKSALAPLMPLLQFLAIVIGGALVGALTFLVGVLVGTIAALAHFVVGLVEILAGIARFVAGVIQFFSGLFQWLIGAVTHNTDAQKSGWANMAGGVINIVQGFWSAIKGLWEATGGAIIAFCQAFWHTIVSIFTSLWHDLVGGSIVTDMMTGIVNAFTGMIARVIGLVTGFVSTIVAGFQRLWSMVQAAFQVGTNMAIAVVTVMVSRIISAVASFVSSMISSVTSLWAQIQSAFSAGTAAAANIVQSLGGRLISIMSGIASSMFSWGQHIVSQIASGINSMLGSVASAASNVAGAIASFLHLSVPEQGPLATINDWMPHFGDQLTTGLNEQVSKVKVAAGNVAAAMVVTPPSIGNISQNTQITATQKTDPQMLTVMQQILAEMKTANQIAQKGGGSNSGGMGNNNNQLGHPLPSINLGSATFGGSQNAQSGNLYQQLNLLAGLASEQASRGACSGIAV